MKFARVGVAIAAAAIVVSACGGGTPTAAPVTDPLGVVQIPAGEPLHIAYWGVLSGADSSLGEDSKQGVEVAIDDLGGKFKGHDIRLTTEDGLCTPDGGATAAQKLAADSTIVGLIGSSCSDETVGGIASLTAAGLTTISPSNTRPALSAPDRDATYAGYLRTAHSDAFQGKAAAEFVFNSLKLTKAATIHDGSTYAQALQGVFADEFVKLGGTITAQEAVTKETTDMSAVLKTVAASKPEIIYFPVFVAAAGFLRAQVSTVSGLENVKTMGADGHFSPDFLKAAGASAVGHYLSSPNFAAFGAGYAGLLEKMAAKFGGKPLSVFHAHAYDATNILFKALEKVAIENADGSLSIPKGALRDAIYATKDFAGITGALTCTPSGDCGAPVIGVYQITQENVDKLEMPGVAIWP
ncbi:MAG: branched-chain amino acid ABC transporter substrate-binding protein [Chloroflexota bacterium]|nr:branched-chain amino acid ABC transporter substrate-binding protein [Chloroflexota bacterium]